MVTIHASTEGWGFEDLRLLFKESTANSSGQKVLVAKITGCQKVQEVSSTNHKDQMCNQWEIFFQGVDH